MSELTIARAIGGGALAALLAVPLSAEPVMDTPMCVLPERAPRPFEFPLGRVNVNEVEPNDTLMTAQVISPFSNPSDVSVFGDNFGEEQDYYSVHLEVGDILGIAVIATGLDPNDIDTFLTVFDPSGAVLLINDDSDAVTAYPASTPMPGTGFRTDSFAAIVASQAGDYTLLVEPFTGGMPPQTSQGPYVMELRLRRNQFESVAAVQTIFVDFNGASINAQALFGGGNNPATLSGLGSFLGNWGLAAGQESAVIDAVLAELEENLSALMFQNPEVDYEILNSRDHADPFGGANVSRVIVGGTIAQLGISTIGIAESIDPGNFDASETAVVLLDNLSSTNPTNGTSLNNVPRAGGATIIDVIGVAIGNLVAHEAGHYIGNWHTLSNNSTRNIMDAGAGTLGDYYQNIVETGPNLIFGDGDDNEVLFVQDLYANEGIGQSPQSREFTNYRTAFGLSSMVDAGECAGDFNDDGMVDGLDLALMLALWGPQPGQEQDLNGDGVIDGADLAQFLANWGPCNP